MTTSHPKVPLLDLAAQNSTVKEEIFAAIESVFATQRFILGPEVEGLEREVADYSGAAHGIGVSSGTDALLVSLMAAGVQAGDDVVTTPYTFFATAGCIARLGARPVFVDIDPVSYNIDPAAIEQAITKQTKCIIPVHLYGQVADMDPICAQARDHKIVVIEDAAQAIGADYKGRRAGAIGDLGCFSFFPSKNLGAFGDGGMVISSDDALADRVKLLRNHGYRPKYYNKVLGGNFRLDALQAAILRVKLPRLDGWTEKRRANAESYRQLFSQTDLVKPAGTDLSRECGLILPVEMETGQMIYNQFVIRSSDRDGLRAFLKERDIGTEIYYPVPMHLQECFSELNYKEGDFPHSERAAAETLALPIYAELTSAMIETVVAAIDDFMKKH